MWFESIISHKASNPTYVVCFGSEFLQVFVKHTCNSNTFLPCPLYSMSPWYPKLIWQDCRLLTIISFLPPYTSGCKCPVFPLPSSLALKCGHVTKFSSTECEQKWCIALRGLSNKKLITWTSCMPPPPSPPQLIMASPWVTEAEFPDPTLQPYSQNVLSGLLRERNEYHFCVHFWNMCSCLSHYIWGIYPNTVEKGLIGEVFDHWKGKKWLFFDEGKLILSATWSPVFLWYESSPNCRHIGSAWP